MNTKAILISISMGIAALQAGAAQYLTDGATPDNLNWRDYTKTPVVVTDEDGEHGITFKSGEKKPLLGCICLQHAGLVARKQ